MREFKTLEFTTENAGTYYDKYGEPHIGRHVMVNYNWGPLKPGDYYIVNKKENLIAEVDENGLHVLKKAIPDK